MPDSNQKKPAGLILLAAPWPLYNRPSIQLGVLKAFLRQQFADVHIDARHIYLQLAAAIGYDFYQSISERTWLAETVYAALLFPEHFDRIENFFRRQITRATHHRLRELDFSELCSQVQEITEQVLTSLSWQKYGLVGLSVSLCQFSASIYMVRRIKKIAPSVTSIVGGSTFSGIPANPVFDLFSEIDLIISGEGELALAHVVRSHLMDDTPLSQVPPIRGLQSRHLGADADNAGFSQMAAIDHLPPPDYDDYFDLLQRLPANRHFFATLPLELSRGCWWQRIKDTESSGCAFCNLNLQWQGYRKKSVAQATAEVDHLTRRHQTLSVAFADNILPAGNSARLFNAISGLQKDLRLFGEIRATTKPSVLKSMHTAGMSEVQIGIEALSNRLLRKLGKGIRTIENLAIMKHCEELGIKNVSNLILLFPGSDETDVAQTLRTLKFAIPYRPLKPVDFWLGRGSPLWHHPREANIRAIFNHPNWAHLFPKQIASKFPFMVLGYRGDRGYQRRLWQPVRAELKVWERSWRELHREPKAEPILSYRDGKDFLIIRQRRPFSPVMTHRLTKTSARIYLCCRQPQPLARIQNKFSGLTETNLRSFLGQMVKKRLMYAEQDRFLSLAVAAKAR